MKRLVAIIGVAVCVGCFAGCGNDGMSYEKYQEVSQMEHTLEQYSKLNEAHILTDDTAADVSYALSEKYSEEETQEIIETMFDNTPELIMCID